MNRKKINKYLHGAFEVGLFMKAFNGIWETLSGTLMLILGGRLVRHLFYIMSRNELFEYPKDDLINFLSQTFDRIPAGAMKFAAVYILIHGVLNIFLVVQLYRERLWAYLVTIGAMIIFIIYQIYRISIYHSRVLTVITVIDVVFIFLAWNEYKLHKEAKMS